MEQFHQGKENTSQIKDFLKVISFFSLLMTAFSEQNHFVSVMIKVMFLKRLHGLQKQHIFYYF